MTLLRSFALPSCFAASWLGLAAVASDVQTPHDLWSKNYADATAAAERCGKMLLIYFYDARDEGACAHFQAETLGDPCVRRKLRDYVCVRLPLDAKISSDGKPVVLLEHPAFGEMLGRPGLAIVDYRSADAKLHGSVVSTFPITEKLHYTAERMAAILDLPAGTLTQRTLIYAVRVHPDKPASTDGEPSPTLLDEAQSHSQYQAQIRRQGHYFWAARFQRILARLPGARAPREICAESWPGQNMVDAAIECVRCWRLSAGHWSAVQARSRFFGYDMRRGANGVWYATGIVGGG
jgi:hypothetical protein